MSMDAHENFGLCDEIKIKRNKPCVYFISDGNGNCKVGVASDIQDRFNTLQVGNAQRLNIKKIEYFEDIDDAYDQEHEYHTRLHSKRVRGEWFEEDAVDRIIHGERECEGIYMCDECKEFDILDAGKLFLILLESKTAEEYVRRYENEMPDYWKKYDTEKYGPEKYTHHLKSIHEFYGSTGR